MADHGCSDVVRFGGDLELAPEPEREGIAAHLSECEDCASYVAQMTTTRGLLARRGDRDELRRRPSAASTEPMQESSTDLDALRTALLARAELLDPRNADDLVQRSLEVGLALQHRDCRPRGIAELTRILHTLGDAQTRLDGCTTPAVDVTAAARARADLLEDLDSEADEPELFYPDLYPSENGLYAWTGSPNQWRGGAQVLGPEEVDETGELFDVLDRSLGELPEPLGELLALVDLRSEPLAESARSLGLDEYAARAALARARNHVRGRLDEYLTSAGPAAYRLRKLRGGSHPASAEPESVPTFAATALPGASRSAPSRSVASVTAA